MFLSLSCIGGISRFSFHVLEEYQDLEMNNMPCMARYVQLSQEAFWVKHYIAINSFCVHAVCIKNKKGVPLPGELKSSVSHMDMHRSCSPKKSWGDASRC